MNFKLTIVASAAAAFFITCLSVSAQESELKIPADVKPFIEKDKTAVAFESADLDLDGSTDHILIVEDSESASNDGNEGVRTMIILIRKGGKLRVAKTNSNVAFCRECGGAFGDPLDSINVKAGSFTVNNYGGSSWRWGYSFKFNYSRRDRTWQLVRSVEESFNSLDPKTMKRKVHTPKSFGKIDIADFDPDKIK